MKNFTTRCVLGEAYLCGWAEPDAVLQVIPLFQVEGMEQGQVGATCTQCVRYSQGVLGDVQHDGSEREKRSVSDGPGVRVVNDILEDLTEVVMVTARLPHHPGKGEPHPREGGGEDADDRQTECYPGQEEGRERGKLLSDSIFQGPLKLLIHEKLGTTFYKLP